MDRGYLVWGWDKTKELQDLDKMRDLVTNGWKMVLTPSSKQHLEQRPAPVDTSVWSSRACLPLAQFHHEHFVLQPAMSVLIPPG